MTIKDPLDISQADIDALKHRYTQAGQGHLFTFWHDLTLEQQAELFGQLEDIDVERVNQIYSKSISGGAVTASDNLEPLPDHVFDSVQTASPDSIRAWNESGMKLISEGKVAVILMAGGQGTRLGSSAPKGCYDINLPSHKSLFQLQAERILRLQNLAKEMYGVNCESVIPWYIMTSGPTHEPSYQFFKANKFFGLKEENVTFFQQGTLPCLTMEGKILLETKHRVAIAPDGNGGIYQALHKEGVIKSLKDRGIEFSHCYCVDNCLARVADPTFIGYCASKSTDCGVKVVGKSSPDEPVGVVCLRDQKYGVVEYSEISQEVSEMRKPDGSLAFGAANIATHFFSTQFLERVPEFADELEYHIAKKKIPSVDLKNGDLLAPKTPNGMKLECFVFDVFAYAHNLSVLQVNRLDEFSPLKNAPGTGVDCPETSRRDIIAQHVRFIEDAGGKIISQGKGEHTLELSPLVTYAGEGLEIVRGKTLNTPAIIESREDLIRCFL
ncbi:hypothetical protein K450DRAFT_103661 [Umbelopsis ramanniana AG]|uniref:UDP-N-acetylglucosamine diphosphorylase n=1 Tax=Umbelopsis ramanniana AG TaxID=1314678 RepID=A0AAD5HGF7_UMBRA|nr:uncharacterized protein K450DRAFT_103661 [Umbelopsis ramanniana AG]KAI8583425.1 hypothetical protein K450DRAFT_103661 [Umbelopsis ramanniana AG]